MAGVMAGTALLDAPARAFHLDTVSLTVNNVCNLSCPHCYLQYNGPSALITVPMIDCVLDARPRHICIVGKEPLANRRSMELTERIVLESARRGISSSLITNGLKLASASPRMLQSLRWIDISLDGGRVSYGSYRKAMLDEVLNGIAAVRENSDTPIRILNTLSRQNSPYLSDMIEICEEIGVDLVMFSPFCVTESDGPQTCGVLAPLEYLAILSSGLKYTDLNWMVSLDAHYLGQFPGQSKEAVERGRENFGERFFFVERDPIVQGMIRVTYDGLVMSPFESIDISNYGVAASLAQCSLLEHYNKLRDRVVAW